MEEKFKELMDKYLSSKIFENTHTRRDIFLAGAMAYKQCIIDIDLNHFA